MSFPADRVSSTKPFVSTPATCNKRRRRMRGSDQARALHAAHPAIDLHADTLMWSRWVGYDLHAAHEPPLPRAALGGHVDLPRMRQGGVGAQFFGLVSLPVADRIRGLARVVSEQIDVLTEINQRVIAANSSLLVSH